MIELIIAISISIVLLTICCNVFQQNFIFITGIDNSLEERANLRIAMDFVSDRIKNAESVSYGNESFLVNSDRIYIKSRILRINTDSQQVAYEIDAIQVNKANEKGLVKITMKSQNSSMETFIYMKGFER